MSGVDLCNQPGTLQYQLSKAESDLLVLEVAPMRPRWRSGVLNDWYRLSLLELRLGEFKGAIGPSLICFSKGNQGELINFWLFDSCVWLRFWIENAIDIAIRKFKRAGGARRGDAR
jgi:hypothetical protein